MYSTLEQGALKAQPRHASWQHRTLADMQLRDTECRNRTTDSELTRRILDEHEAFPFLEPFTSCDDYVRA